MNKAVKKVIVLSVVISFIAGFICGSIRILRSLGETLKKTKARLDMFEGFYRPMKEWFAKEQAGCTLKNFLMEKNYCKIGIYGMGDFANRIYDALKDSPIEVVCCIDSKKSAYSDTTLFTLEDELPDMDAIIITDYKNADSIIDSLSKKGDFELMLLEDIIYNEL